MPVRLFMLTDLHYTPGYVAPPTRFCGDSLRKIRQIADVLRGADLCVQLGDLIHGTGDARRDASALQGALQELSVYRFHHVLGNHDAFSVGKSGILPHTAGVGCMDRFSLGGVDFLTLDGNFRQDGGEYSSPGGDWKDAAIPSAQLAALERFLWESRGAVVFCHQNLDDCPEDPHVLRNAGEVRALLEKSGKVRYVFQGHCHAGRDTVTAGIRYHTLPALCEEDRIPYCIADIYTWDRIIVQDYEERLCPGFGSVRNE